MKKGLLGLGVFMALLSGCSNKDDGALKLTNFLAKDKNGESILKACSGNKLTSVCTIATEENAVRYDENSHTIRVEKNSNPYFADVYYIVRNELYIAEIDSDGNMKYKKSGIYNGKDNITINVEDDQYEYSLTFMG